MIVQWCVVKWRLLLKSNDEAIAALERVSSFNTATVLMVNHFPKDKSHFCTVIAYLVSCNVNTVLYQYIIIMSILYYLSTVNVSVVYVLLHCC